MPDNPLDEEAIFNVASRITQPDVRADYLGQVCGDNPALAKRVEVLLLAHDQDNDFLDSPVTSDNSTQILSSIAERPGTVIGRYKLMEQIGEGGMGVVFVAHQQQPVRRQVALKVIKPGMDSKEVVARFEAERQALAMMDHPNIARVFDGDVTSSGRPFFVMEFVQGVPITEYCDQRGIPLDHRLTLFMSVCHAIQHAHHKGIIHRDIKPSNVLITVHDDVPVPKVIDFGVAKAISSELTQKTVYTRFRQIIGTPAYMSPEQAKYSGLDIDTRTDIYSLGVLLYELITGTTPLEKNRFESVDFDEIRRIIDEEEPPRPSTRIETLGKTDSTVSDRLKIAPEKLVRTVRGDLDWIVMKALEKDRTRRYESASQFAKDVERYLAHQPIAARPPSIVYRLQKFGTRHRSKMLWAFAALLICAIASLAIWNAREMAGKQRLAELRAKAHQDIQLAEEKIGDGDVEAAFFLLEDAKLQLPGDRKIAAMLSGISTRWRVNTDPPGATIELRNALSTDTQWRTVGESNLEFDNPVGLYHWRVAKRGFGTIEGTAGVEDVRIERTLISESSAPENMVFVTSRTESGKLVTFWVDRHEVTNLEFKKFVDAGGYQDESYWRHLRPYKWDDLELSFEALTARLIDSTGNQGPSPWANSTYPAGKGNHPVGGVSWYEASAYAKFVDKILPTQIDWQRAACVEQADQLKRWQVFGESESKPVSASGALNALGVFDMGGNVKEWCLNETNDGRRIARGGAWNEHTYMFRGVEAFPVQFRPENIGFRCVKHETRPPLAEAGQLRIAPAVVPLAEGFTDEELLRVQGRYAYNSDAPLNAKTLGVRNSDAWKHETTEIDAAYGGERFSLHLFYPSAASYGDHQYQPLVYFPGNGVTGMEGIDQTGRWADLAIVVGAVQTGRVVCWPVYKGTLERTDGFSWRLEPHRRLEYFIQQTQDLSRAIDFLATRPELDIARLGYIGWSRGGSIGARLVVLEPRFKACILMSGGLRLYPSPEIDTRKFAPLVKIPCLQLGGRYDTMVNYESRQVPLFNSLGCSDKEFVEFDSGHVMQLEKAVATIDEWLKARFPHEDPNKRTPSEQLQWNKSLATGYMGESLYELAEAKFTLVIDILQDTKGLNSRETLEAEFNRAVAIERQGRFADAQELLEGILERQKVHLGVDHSDTQKTSDLLQTLDPDKSNSK